MRKILLTTLGLTALLSGCANRSSASAGKKASGSASAASGAASGASAAASGPALPPAGARLNDMGFRCEVVLVSPPEEFRMGGPPMPMKVKLTKRTSEVWPVQAPGVSSVNVVNLAYRWLDEKTGTLVKEGGRSSLAGNIADGATVDVDVMIASPGAPGSYVLKVEPVQEGVAWFSERSTCFQTTHIKAKL